MTTSLVPPPVLARSVDRFDEHLAEIRALLAEIESGVTAKDPDRCVARFAADARSIIASGARSIGRDAIRAAHVTAFAGALATTIAHFEVLDVLFVRPDVVLVTTGAWAAQQDHREIELDPASVVSYLLVREQDAWWVAHRQFTKVASKPA